MEAIASGDQTASDIARRAGMSILELAAHVCTPRNLEALERVKQLHEIQREILLGQLKRKALMRLAELTDEVPAASTDEIRAAEVMRKACVDLLRFGGSAINSNTSRNPSGHDHTPAPLNEEKILEALVRWDERMDGEINKGGTDCDRRESSVGPGSLVPWSKAKPQAMSGGRDVVKEVEKTHDVQVGMAFGKTSDHGTGLSEMTNRTRTRRVPPLEEAICRGCHGQVPPARVCEKQTHPRAKPLKQRPCPWHPDGDCDVDSLSPIPHGQTPKTPLAHATHDPLRHPRPPPARSPPNAKCLLPIAFLINTEKRWRHCRRFRGGRAFASSPSTEAG